MKLYNVSKFNININCNNLLLELDYSSIVTMVYCGRYCQKAAM